MKVKIILLVLVSFFMLCQESVSAQTTEFTYQGRLLFGGVPANGSFDFEFRLFDDAGAGTQQGPTQSLTAVNVVNGVFSVRLDFGNQFPGAARFLDINVRQSGDPGFTALAPRQSITSAPYAIRSLNADSATNATAATNASQLNGLDAAQYVLATDARLSDARNPLPHSINYIQNSGIPQPLSNFNVSGNGTVGATLSGNLVNAQTEFRLGGNRILGTPGTDNLFVGVGAGFSTTSGHDNAFFGSSAGAANTTGSGNVFFGQSSGLSNSTGSGNSFFGRSSGQANTSGISNSFFGFDAGISNTTGQENTFVGRAAGLSNTTAGGNSFFGFQSGSSNTTGINNSFFGTLSGFSNTTGFANTFSGSLAGFSNTNGAENSFFGLESGLSNTTGIGNSFFGDAAGGNNKTGNGNVFIGTNTGILNVNGSNNTALGAASGITADNLTNATAIGAGAAVSASNTIQLGRSIDHVRISGLGTAGSTSLCRNANNEVSVCSSSIRYKSNINAFASGLDLVQRLRPVTFQWKEGGMLDLGLVAEDVNKVAPLLTTTNEKGEIEGVKYDRLGVVLINSIKEQQAQIEAQQKQIEQQQQTIIRQQQELAADRKEFASLKLLVCSTKRRVELCRATKDKPRTDTK